MILSKVNNKIPIIFILGHTASNKTKSSFIIKDRFPVEIISVDSSMIFREMNIGTSKPNYNELIKYPHKIINIRDPIQKYSVFDFYKDAFLSINDILINNNIPLFVGGSIFYFNILLKGIELYNSLFINLNIKKNINNINKINIKKYYDNIINCNLTKKNFNINNKIKIFNNINLKLFIESSKNFYGINNNNFNIYQIILINNNKLKLKKKIKYRLFKMIEKGFENEVLNLFNRGDLNLNTQSIKSIGYKHMWLYLSSKISYIDMIKEIFLSNMNLYKHQMTWLKNWNFNKKIFDVSNNYNNELIKYINKIIKKYYFL